MKILLITPPFTQLNTPYPATAYLKGFLNLHGHDLFQADLGIELMNRLFSRDGLGQLFDAAGRNGGRLSPNARLILSNRQNYIETVEPIMRFLLHRDSTLAQRICGETFLPRASRFDQLPDLEWSFGNMGVNDRARFLATLAIEDIGDLIRESITPFFGFSRYAEKLGMSAHDFTDLHDALHQRENIIETWMLELLQGHMDRRHPDVVGITIPFPGNLYAGLKCGQFIKRTAPAVKVIAGGGFVSTELRELSEPAIFNYVDYLTLDDGELPFLNILKLLRGEFGQDRLKRTFLRDGGGVKYFDNDAERDPSLAETGCPDYSDLPLDRYLSLIEIANPMHRLWSDGRWNKLTVAHGCYWHQCSFCDTSLDYIRRYDSVPAQVLADRIEQIIAQTGQTGFHFVDEAAPPAALKELALELLRRRTAISWWANIRFEQAFSRDLCRLLAASGCIAASGGLEAASDRVLKLMNKGVTIRQAAQACRNLSDAGIMVHAYLMYGFPTQTAQETVDALEIVRQFFDRGIIQSAFWHRFTATVHSDVGRDPAKYHCTIIGRPAGAFARNDLVHDDPEGCDHDAYAQSLNKAVYNFMHGLGTELPVTTWFDHRIPAISVRQNYVEQAISGKPAGDDDQMRSRLVWIENLPQPLEEEPVRRRKHTGHDSLVVHSRTGTFTLPVTAGRGVWLTDLLTRSSPGQAKLPTLDDVKQEYERLFAGDIGILLRSREWKALREKGLLLI